MTYRKSNLTNSTFRVPVPADPNINLVFATIRLQATHAHKAGYSVILLQSQKKNNILKLTVFVFRHGLTQINTVFKGLDSALPAFAGTSFAGMTNWVISLLKLHLYQYIT